MSEFRPLKVDIKCGRFTKRTRPHQIVKQIEELHENVTVNNLADSSQIDDKVRNYMRQYEWGYVIWAEKETNIAVMTRSW